MVTLARAKSGKVHEPLDKPSLKADPEQALKLPKPGEVLLLKGEAKAERERAIEAGEVQVFPDDEGKKDDGAPMPDILRTAEDVFSTPKAKPPEDADSPPPSPNDDTGS